MVTVILLIILGSFEDSAPKRNIARDHQVVWSQGAFTIFKYRIDAHDRTVVRSHSRPILTIPLMDEKVLESDTSSQDVVWTMRTGIGITEPTQHAIFNPNPKEVINVEIEFPPSDATPLIPRFSQGIQEQYFKFPQFVLGRHLLRRDQLLTGVSGCEGAVIAMSHMILRVDQSNTLIKLATGDAINAREGLRNVSDYPVAVLTVCPKLSL